MKPGRAIWLFALLFMFAAVARANPVDPGIGFGGSGSCFEQPMSQTSPVQTFTIPTGCIADFTNNIGSNIESFTIIVNTEFSGSLGCTFLPNNTFFSMINTGSNFCTFSGPPPGPSEIGSIGTGATYGIMATSDFGPEVSLTLSAPEPGTMLLLGTGLAAVVARRKHLKGAKLDA